MRDEIQKPAYASAIDGCLLVIFGKLKGLLLVLDAKLCLDEDPHFEPGVGLKDEYVNELLPVVLSHLDKLLAHYFQGPLALGAIRVHVYQVPTVSVSK